MGSMIILLALAGATNVGIHTLATQRGPASMSNGPAAACTRQDFRRESVRPIPLDDSVQGQWMAGQDRPTTPENFSPCANCRAHHSFWSVLSKNGIAVGMANVPATFPDTNYVDIDPEAMCATRAFF